MTALQSQNGIFQFLFPLQFVHLHWENEKQNKCQMGKSLPWRSMERRGTFSTGTDASPAAEWLAWWHMLVHCQVTTLLPRCQVLWLQEKIKCGVSKWDSNTWSASKGLASRESPASGNQDNCLLCAAFMVDLPAREWVPFIKVNLIAYLCGSTMQSLWLEGFYQQNNVG